MSGTNITLGQDLPLAGSLLTPCPWCVQSHGEEYAAKYPLEADLEVQRSPELFGLHCCNCHMPSDWDPLLRCAIIPPAYD
jgi:hypothetical protein